MASIKKWFFNFWSVASLLAIVNLIIFDLVILFGSENIRVQFTPDDTYYYLQLAKNFAESGRWTFDSGISLTTGFHPLLAYLLVLLYRFLQPSIESFVIYAVALSVLLTIFVGVYIWQKGLRVKNVYFLLFAALFISSQGFLFNSVSGVEWAIVIVLAMLYCFIFYESTETSRTPIVLFLIGLLLSLARTDSGLLPLAIFLASIALTTPKSWKNSGMVRSSLAGLLGASIAVGLVLLHSYWVTGNFLQTSAQMKLFWSQFDPFRVNLVSRALGFDVYFKGMLNFFETPFFVSLLVVFLGFMGVREYNSAAPSRFSWLKHQNNRGLVLFVASALSVAGYLILYLFDGGVQNWYTANLQIPLFILCIGIAWCLQKYYPQHETITLVTLSVISLVTILLNLLATYPVAVHSPWPHQQIMLAAGKYLNHNPLGGRIGAWNAGVIGYYEGGNVINLDGLVNNDIYPYAVMNNLPAYLKEKNIVYVIDFEPMFTIYAKRGGYEDPDFLRGLQPLIQFDQGQFDWKFLTLYQVGGSHK